MSIEQAPLNITVSVLEVGHSVEISKIAYYDDFSSIPSKPFLLGNSNLKSILGSERSGSNHEMSEQ